MRPSHFVYLLLSVIAFTQVAYAERLKPFVLAWEGEARLETVLENTRRSLAAVGFEVVGDYQPQEDTHVLVVTAPLLRKMAAQERNAAFLVAQSVAIRRVSSQVQVSYRNPHYCGLAYRVEADVAALAEALDASLGFTRFFGSEAGLGSKRLARYQYSYGMEYFDDQLLLRQFASQAEALEGIERGFRANSELVGRVYRIDVNDAMSVFGVAMRAGQGADAQVHAVLDSPVLSHMAQLPYEILVHEGVVSALHPRFRLALNFPDVKMVGERSFLQLRDAPDQIHAALKLLASDKQP